MVLRVTAAFVDISLAIGMVFLLRRSSPDFKRYFLLAMEHYHLQLDLDPRN
jgi:hypothetical protein